MVAEKLTPPFCGGNPDTRAEFSVYVWPETTDGHYRRVKAYVGARKALTTARRLAVGNPARIMITDGWDHCCFEWQRGVGVTFPQSGEGDAP
jgi:hypothetical protein